MKVLYIHAVGPWGGSSRSLFEAISNLPENSVDPYFILVEGTSLNYFSKISKNIITTKGLTRFDNTQYGHYRGLRWLILLRELYHLPFTFNAIYKAKKQFKNVDIIHVNDFLELIPMLFAKFMFKAPVVMHVRCVSRLKKKSIRTYFVDKIIKKYANAIVSIDETTKASLSPDLKVDVIHNSFTAKYADIEDKEFNSKIGALKNDSFKIGFVGSLMHAKGIFELVEAARILKEKGKNADILFVGGEAPFGKGIKEWVIRSLGFRQFMKKQLMEKIKEYKLESSIYLSGHTNDIQRAYEKMDVICVPGHADAPGRQVIEAAFSSVPTILAITNPIKDTLQHMETGIAVPLRNNEKLAEAIEYFIDRPEEAKRMGNNARELAALNFDPKRNSKKILEIYKRIFTLKN